MVAVVLTSAGTIERDILPNRLIIVASSQDDWRSATQAPLLNVAGASLRTDEAKVLEALRIGPRSRRNGALINILYKETDLYSRVWLY
jgi:hypothetical protein